MKKIGFLIIFIFLITSLFSRSYSQGPPPTSSPADLTITNASACITSGNAIQYTATVRNQGGTNISTSFEVRGAIFSTSTQYASTTINSLPVGNSTTVTWTSSSYSQGIINGITGWDILADSTNVISESIEVNNTWTSGSPPGQCPNPTPTPTNTPIPTPTPTGGVCSSTTPRSVSGIVFDDKDQDGIKDPFALGQPTESGIPGVRVELRQNNNPLGPLLAFTTTDGDGEYTLTGQVCNNPLGLADVVEIDPPGYVSSTPNTVAWYTFDPAYISFGDYIPTVDTPTPPTNGWYFRGNLYLTGTTTWVDGGTITLYGKNSVPTSGSYGTYISNDTPQTVNRCQAGQTCNWRVDAPASPCYRYYSMVKTNPSGFSSSSASSPGTVGSADWIYYDFGSACNAAGYYYNNNYFVSTSACQITNLVASDYVYPDRIHLTWTINGAADPNFDHVLIRRGGVDYVSLSKTSTFYTDVTGCGQGYFYRLFCARSNGSVIAGSGPYTPPPGTSGDAADNGYSQACVTGPPITQPPTATPTTPPPTPTFTPAPAAGWFQTLGGNALSKTGSISSAVPSGEQFNIAINNKASEGVSYSTSINPGSGQPGKNAASTAFPELLSYAELLSRFDSTNTPSGGSTLTPGNLTAGSGSLGNTIAYEVSGVTLQGWTGFTGNAVIFVDGDLTIDENVTVSPGSFLGFVVSKDITVDSAVDTVEGFYYTDKDFLTGLSSTALSLNGTFVAKEFVLNRDLGAGNSTLPAEKFNYRPDFAFTAPQELRRPYRHFQEVAP